LKKKEEEKAPLTLLEAYLLSLHHSSPHLASFSSSKHREINEVSRGEVATRAPVGNPIAADPIEVQH